MKPRTTYLMVAVSLAGGFFAGRSLPNKNSESPSASSRAEVRETKVIRPSRTDPFGGPEFSLKSMDDVRELFKKQRGAVANARVTLAVETLSAKELPELMELIQKDFRENPGYLEGRWELANTVFEKWAMVDPDAAVGFVKSCKSRSFQSMAAQSCFSGLAQADPERAKMELATLPKGELRKNAGMAIISTLSNRDPKAACELLASEPVQGGFGTYYARSAFTEWAKKDPAAAAACLATMPKDRVDEDCAGAIAAGWAKTDPEAALRWAKTQKGEWKNSAAQSVYRELALDDPTAAWEQLKAEPGHLRNRLIGTVLDTVSDEDSDKALSLLDSLRKGSDKRIATESFVDQLRWWGLENQKLALKVIDGMEDSNSKRQLLANQMYGLAWYSPDLLRERISMLSERDKVSCAEQMLRGMLESDAKGAENYFLSLPEAQRGTEALSEMMQRYANLDPQKAGKFALSLQNPREQTAALNSLFSQWSREDPEAAAEGWKKLPGGQSRMEALDQIASWWGRSDPDAARAWANGLSGNDRIRALSSVLPSMAEDQPANAASTLSALISSAPDGLGVNLAQSAGQVASTWAADDPTAASRWAAGLPSGSAREEGLKAVSAAWSQYDAVATAEWLGTLEAGSSRDAAIEPLVEHVRDTDPNTAFSWAASISDENDRFNQLRETLKTWRSTDLRAARTAFEGADLSPKDRERLAKVLE